MPSGSRPVWALTTMEVVKAWYSIFLNSDAKSKAFHFLVISTTYKLNLRWEASIQIRYLLDEWPNPIFLSNFLLSNRPSGKSQAVRLVSHPLRCDRRDCSRLYDRSYGPFTGLWKRWERRYMNLPCTTLITNMDLEMQLSSNLQLTFEIFRWCPFLGWWTGRGLIIFVFSASVVNSTIFVY